jgi:hypothetical protein
MNARVVITRFQLTIVTLVGLFACTRPSTISGPQIPSTQVSSPESNEKNSLKSWQISPTSETQHYSTLVTTTIQQLTTAQAATDSITTRARYNLNITQLASSVSLTGSVEAFVLQAGNRISSEAMVSSFPVLFTGQIQNHQLKLDVISNDHSATTPTLSCEILGKTALTMVQRNLFVTPLRLQPGMIWQDSLLSTSCSGSLELNLTILRNYKVIGESIFNGTSAIVIDITEKTLSAGEGSQDQHRLIIKGEGLKSGRLYLDQTTGILLSLSSETHTTLQIQTSGQIQHFLQTSRETTIRM